MYVTDPNRPITTDLRHLSLTANNITAKLNNQCTQTGLSTFDWQQPFTWLWWWLPLRLSKCQSPLPTTVLLRTILTRTIKLHYYMLPLGSNHLLYFNFSYDLKTSNIIKGAFHLAQMSDSTNWNPSPTWPPKKPNFGNISFLHRFEWKFQIHLNDINFSLSILLTSSKAESTSSSLKS